jgi:acetyl esterase/lipase
MSWGVLTQAERDAAYNNGAAVPNSPQLIKQRNEASALYRAAHTGHLDLPYADGERTKWDIYPAQNPSAPCLVFIHGGYWQMNRREDFAIFAQGIAEHGWSVAMPGYSLAPEVTLAQIVAELRTALDWLAINGPEHGISGRVIVSGWSAGGQLAALLLDHGLIRSGLAISGVFELGPLRDTYLNAKLKLTEPEIAALSPLRLPVIPKPLAIAYGSRELPALVNDSRDFHALRAAAHAPGALLPIAGADHFTILHELQSPASTLVKTILALI